MDRRADRRIRTEALQNDVSDRDIRHFSITAKPCRFNTSSGSSKERIRLSAFLPIPQSARLLSLALGAIISMGVFSAAQKPTAATQQDAGPRTVSSESLPKECLAARTGSDQISLLLDTVKDHPTSGAYNTLGGLVQLGVSL